MSNLSKRMSVATAFLAVAGGAVLGAGSTASAATATPEHARRPAASPFRPRLFRRPNFRWPLPLPYDSAPRVRAMKSLKTVIRGLPVQLVVSHEMSVSVSVRLQYEPSDPHVVRAAFDVVGSDETVEWIIGRDLLADGLEGPAGEGDIRVWPVEEEHDGSDLYILLNPPDGTALLKAPAREIKAFLRETEAVVPRGAESGRINLDALLAHLIAEG